jgi:hypothetical protein
VNEGLTYGATKKACGVLDEPGGLDEPGHMWMVPV